MSGNGFFFFSKVAGIHRYLQSIFTNITTSYTSLITALKSFIIKINKLDIFNMDHMLLNILRRAFLSQQVRIMTFSIHIVYTEIAMVRKHLSASEIACKKYFTYCETNLLRLKSILSFQKSQRFL